MARTVRKFSKAQIAEIANYYADPKTKHARDYFAEKYGINHKRFYAILEKAIIQGIVSDEIVKAMKYKAENNAREKVGNKAINRTREHYSRIMKQRKEYQLPKKQAVKIAKEYSITSVPKSEFARKNYMTVELLNRTIKRCIIENLIEDDVVRVLEMKSLAKDNSEKVQIFWRRLWEIRKENMNQG